MTLLSRAPHPVTRLSCSARARRIPHPLLLSLLGGDVVVLFVPVLPVPVASPRSRRRPRRRLRRRPRPLPRFVDTDDVTFAPKMAAAQPSRCSGASTPAGGGWRRLVRALKQAAGNGTHARALDRATDARVERAFTWRHGPAAGDAADAPAISPAPAPPSALPSAYTAPRVNRAQLARLLDSWAAARPPPRAGGRARTVARLGVKG